MKNSINKGDRPALGASHQITLAVGWTDGDGSGHEGYQVADYFDSRGVYLGPDEHGIEPIFRDMTEEEASAYLAQEGIGPTEDIGKI